MFGVAYFPCIFGNHLLMWPRDVERCQSTPALPRCVKRLADACGSGEGNGCGREMCQDMSEDLLGYILVIQPRYPVLGVGAGGIETLMSAGPPCVQGVRHFPLYVDAW